MSESLSERIVRVALSQVGERERAPNVTVYHDWYDAHGAYKYRGQPWCAIFVCWVLDQAGARLPTIQGAEFGAYPGAAGVSILQGWMEQRGWVLSRGTDPGPGDIVFFKWSHVGVFIRDYDKYIITTVEGNTSAMPPNRDDTVWPHLRTIDRVSCYVRVPENFSTER